MDMDMDILDKIGREAILRYHGGHYDILRHGDFVYCAVTGCAIPLSELCYWSVSRQEAYCSAEAGVSRLEEGSYAPYFASGI